MGTDPEKDNNRELELERFLPYRLNILAEIVSQSLAGVYSRQYGIGIPEWRVIANLGLTGTLSAKQIGIRTHMHKTKVSRAIAALELSGLIARHTDENDKRSIILSLTDKGKDTYNRIVPVALRFAGELESALDPEDVEVLDRILSRLKQKSKEMAKTMNHNIDQTE